MSCSGTHRESTTQKGIPWRWMENESHLHWNIPQLMHSPLYTAPIQITRVLHSPFYIHTKLSNWKQLKRLSWFLIKWVGANSRVNPRVVANFPLLRRWVCPCIPLTHLHICICMYVLILFVLNWVFFNKVHCFLRL